MAHTTSVAFPEENSVGWERALHALLVENEPRSGSARTIESYPHAFQDFIGQLGKAPDEFTLQKYLCGLSTCTRRPHPPQIERPAQHEATPTRVGTMLL